jgi:hypothetical protein
VIKLLAVIITNDNETVKFLNQNELVREGRWGKNGECCGFYVGEEVMPN